jgi:hypothetical protein
MNIGITPNIQPDGGMGLWIEVSGKKNLGEFQVKFDEKTIEIVGGGDELITASIPILLLQSPGEHIVSLKRVQDGKNFMVGTFLIDSIEPSK